MRKSHAVLFIAILFAFAAISGGLTLFGCGKKEKPEEPVQDSTIAELKFLVLEGSPYNRGLNHGKTFKSEILALVGLWKSNLKGNLGTDPDAFISQYLSKTDYMPAIRKHTPDLLEEVKGIAEGSGLDFNTIYAFQLLDEFIMNTEEIHGEKCTTVGVNRIGDKPAYMGQNWDIAGRYNHFQTAFHIKHESSDLESFVFGYPGFIGAFGLNNQRVGVCVNGMYQLNHSREGLPVAFIVRGVLEKSNQEQAISFLKNIQHASPQNYLIGGPEEIVAYECSPNKAVQFEIDEDSEVVYHTNHTIINDDYTTDYLNHLKQLQGTNMEHTLNYSGSYIRFDAVAHRMSIPPEEITISTMKAALSSHDSRSDPICHSYVDDSSVLSLVSTVMVLSDPPEFHLAPGPPDVTPYEVFKFSE